MKKYIFIAGLHRSGTSLIADALKTHPNIRSFTDTGFPEDEGQFLQSVFPLAKEYGGPGVFGFSREMHLTENSGLLTDENKKKLQSEWSQYWGGGEIFLEKSPPNILKTRFLQEIFPDSYFIIVYRHPVAVSYATQKWSKTSISSLIKHWIHCYSIYNNDRKYLKNKIELKYEDFISDPSGILSKIASFAGISSDFDLSEIEISEGVNEKYFAEWNKYISRTGFFDKIKYKYINRYINKYNYDLFF